MSGPTLLFPLPWATTLLCLGLTIGCRGTEVGNGKTDGSSGSPEKAVPTSASPDSEKSSAGESNNDSWNSGSTAKIWLLSACASPIAENMSGTFVDESGSPSLSVIANSASSKTVSWDDITYKVATAPSNGTFAISSEPKGPDVSCEPVQTLFTASGVQRSLVLSNGVQVVWELAGGTVVKLSIHFDPRMPSLVLTKQ